MKIRTRDFRARKQKGRIIAIGTPEELIGAASTTTRIHFRLADGASPPDRFAARMNGSSWEIETETPTPVVHELTGWALESGTELADLQVTRQSLEDVYLQLTADAPEVSQ